MNRIRFVIHVGPWKTGSTSLQAFLKLNRGFLKSQGILYPTGLVSDDAHHEIPNLLTNTMSRFINIAFDKNITVGSLIESYLDELRKEALSVILISSEDFAGLNSDQFTELITQVHNLKECDIELVYFDFDAHLRQESFVNQFIRGGEYINEQAEKQIFDTVKTIGPNFENATKNLGLAIRKINYDDLVSNEDIFQKVLSVVTNSNFNLKNDDIILLSEQQNISLPKQFTKILNEFNRLNTRGREFDQSCPIMTSDKFPDEQSLFLFFRESLSKISNVSKPPKVISNSSVQIVNESNFSEELYLAANKDVAAAVARGGFESGFEHFKKHGHREGRVRLDYGNTTPIDNSSITRSDFALEISEIPETNILEIGPLNKPLITSGSCSYFDLFDTEQLKEKAKGANLDPSSVPFIRFHHPNGDLGVINEKFDSVVSAHCVEHQPDLIHHLNQVSKLCKAIGSKYWVVLPDKRFCFDHFIPESRLSEIIVANNDSRRQPTNLSVLEHLALTTHNDAGRHWAGDHGIFAENLTVRWRSAQQHFEAAQGAYIDVHCWQFTPTSFPLLINALFELGYIDFECTRVHETKFNDLEFFAVLEKRR